MDGATSARIPSQPKGYSRSNVRRTPGGIAARQTPWKPSQPAMTSHSSSCGSPSWTNWMRGRCRRAFSASVLLETSLEDVERAVRGWDAEVHRALQQHLADLLVRDAVPTRTADVKRELVETAERDQRRQRDAAPRPPIETG